MKNYIIIAAIAALGFTACEEKKAEVEKKTKEEAGQAVDKAADAAKSSEAVKAAGAGDKVDAAAGVAKEKIGAAGTAPSAPKPTTPEPTTDEVINAPPDAAPAPAPRK